ncbi:MAG: deoxyribodipyrimidine photo-lyase [Proteobacteria bacterium]|nr:deoxyribodipyrimidine photo-lyase [Pseudomonadota bacterium]
MRNDLRLTDNPALYAAAKSGMPVYVVYIHDTAQPWAVGGASKWWLHHSLHAFTHALGGNLNLYIGDSAEVIRNLVKRLGVTHLYWNRTYEPAAIQRDTSLKATLRQQGVQVESFNGSLLQEPCDVRNKSGEPFKVFTPFWRALQTLPMRTSLPTCQPTCLRDNKALPLDALDLLPRIKWDSGLAQHWQAGEAAADDRLEAFIANTLPRYADSRDLPAVQGTSRLSPHLHFGEISPIRVWHRIKQEVEKSPNFGQQADKFFSELAWREFSAHLLTHTPSLPDTPLRTEFAAFPWQADYAENLTRWQRGQTGFPIIDAGMRELWHTGYMHNRVRMLVASMLVKNMLIPWQEGEKWFWDTLVDADLANNSASWQWVAGCGADAAPYFRIFNPVLQGQKFDPDGTYVRRWVPELAKLDTRYIHAPWEAPKDILLQAGIMPGTTYPRPCIDLKATRDRALAAFAKIRKAG